MGYFFRVIFASIFALLLANILFAQDDETRQQNQLPVLMTNRSGDNLKRNSDATVSGVVVVQGVADGQSLPPLSIVLISNGTVLERRRVQNKGVFNFTNIPRLGITLVLQAFDQEVARCELGTINGPPLDNHQDIIVSNLQLDQAVKYHNEVISVLNSYPRTDEHQKLFEKAFEVRKEKRSDARKMFKQLTEADPKDYVAWNELGNVDFADEKYGDAEPSYNRSLDLKSDFQPALLNLGKLYLIQKQFDPAIDLLSKALAISPDSPDVNHFLGEAYLQAKKGSKAVIYLNRAIELAPQANADIHLRLATLYNGANLKDRAADEYKKFLLKVPNYPDRSTLEKYIRDNPPK